MVTERRPGIRRGTPQEKATATATATATVTATATAETGDARLSVQGIRKGTPLEKGTETAIATVVAVAVTVAEAATVGVVAEAVIGGIAAEAVTRKREGGHLGLLFVWCTDLDVNGASALPWTKKPRDAKRN